MAVGYLLTKATSGFPESCLFFQASGHYITLWFLGRPRVLVWGWGNQLGGAVASVTPNLNCSSSSPGKSLLDEGGAIQNVAKRPGAGLQERRSGTRKSGHDAADSCPVTWMGSYTNSLVYEETRATSMAELLSSALPPASPLMALSLGSSVVPRRKVWRAKRRGWGGMVFLHLTHRARF